MINTTAATQLQSAMTQGWERACEWLDRMEPLTERFYANMERRVWQPMARFDAVEDSLRRSGFEGCIRGEQGCDAFLQSCQHCSAISKAASATRAAAAQSSTRRTGCKGAR